MNRAFLVVLAACGGSATAAAPAPRPTIDSSATAAGVLAPPSAVASVTSSASRQCDDTDLEKVRYEWEYVGVSDSKPYDFLGKEIKDAVRECFEKIPRERRSTDAVHAVILEWPNSSFEGRSSGFDSYGGEGARNYPPKVNDADFTTCVTNTIPKQSASTMSNDAAKIRAIKLSVLAYTRGAVKRHLMGTIGRWGGASGGYGRGGDRSCARLVDDE